MDMLKTDALARVCGALLEGDRAGAAQIARREYPFVPPENAGRHYSNRERMRIFTRDGFIDRYTGARLVFPGALRLLSRELPEEFPFHKNGKMSECHVMHWDLYPSIDHVVPVARGGAHDESNWVTTSMMRNAAKGNSLIEDIGWAVRPIEASEAWDGLVGWFREYVKRDGSVLGIVGLGSGGGWCELR